MNDGEKEFTGSQGDFLIVIVFMFLKLQYVYEVY